jgi:hypothetical protein
MKTNLEAKIRGGVSVMLHDAKYKPTSCYGSSMSVE